MFSLVVNQNQNAKPIDKTASVSMCPLAVGPVLCAPKGALSRGLSASANLFLERQSLEWQKRKVEYVRRTRIIAMAPLLWLESSGAKKNQRLISAFTLESGTRLRIITEADRRATAGATTANQMNPGRCDSSKIRFLCSVR
jgi:hypothetical protein